MKRSTFIYGYYGLGNLGDDLLLETIIGKLTECGFADKYYIRNLGPISGLTNIEKLSFTNIEKKLFSAGTTSTIRQATILFSYLWEHGRLFRRCHTLILGGGTLLSDKMSLKTLLILAMLVALARLQGTKIVALGLGVTSISGYLRRFLARFILRAASKVCIRDESSLEACRSLSPKTSFVLTADLVFSANIAHRLGSKNQQILEKNQLTLAFTLAEPFLSGQIEGVNRHKVLHAVAASIKYCIGKGHSVKLVGFQRLDVADKNSISDISLFETLVTEHEIKGAELVDISHSIDSLPALYENLHIVVGMRFHSLVLSALSNVPFVGISCDHKVSSLCKSFGMPCIDASEISSIQLIESIEEAKKLKIDDAVLNSLQTRSQLNFSC